MKFSLPVPLFVAAAALALISCGGGGDSPGGGHISATGRAIQNVQRLSIMSLSKSGLELAPFMLHGFGNGGGGTTGSGGIGGVSPIGFFFRHFGESEPSGGTTGGTTGSSTTTTGTTGSGADFYYDEYLGLWVSMEWSDTSSTTTFSLDQQGTLPAGHVSSTYTADWGSYPQTFTNEYEFTAGPLAGSHGTYNCTQTSADVGSMVYENTYADGASDSGESHWNTSESTWESRWEGAGGTPWFEDSGTWTAGGSGNYTFSNSDGWTSNWTYNADWSGTATFIGPNALLPAVMTWTSDGHYHITYADGTTESWTWEDFWGDAGGGGTTGVGTSGTTG